jgi:hypothetical protein
MPEIDGTAGGDRQNEQRLTGKIPVWDIPVDLLQEISCLLPFGVNSAEEMALSYAVQNTCYEYFIFDEFVSRDVHRPIVLAFSHSDCFGGQRHPYMEDQQFIRKAEVSIPRSHMPARLIPHLSGNKS